jgi:sugar transferase (PEP-CTERM/EpsH1 system associated)
MPIRIMHVLHSMGNGGLENGLLNLLERMDARRFEHVVCTVRGLGPRAERLPRDRVPIVALGPEGSTSRFQTPALVRTIRQFEPDIVHSRNWGAIEAVFAGRLMGRAVIHSEHGLEAEAGANEPTRRAYLRRLAFEASNRVVSVSFQLRDLHAARTGFPARRIAVIHNGVDRGRFYPDAETRRSVRRELRIDDNELCIGCVANLFAVKDHMTLLAALRRLSTQRTGWRLLLIGEGPERARLEAFIGQHPDLARRASLLGSSTRVPALLRAMDVFVLPSVAEGINNSLLEAMATGVAVIASAVGGNSEVVVDRESGLLFPPGDVDTLCNRLRSLLKDADRRRQLAQRATQRIDEQFSIQSMVHTYEQLYGNVGRSNLPVLAAGQSVR